MDLSATCLAAAGVTPSLKYPLDGQNLLPILERSGPIMERTLFWRMGNRTQRAVRRGDWKYLKVEDREFLFDLAYDPRERGNLAKKHPSLLTELRSLYEQWQQQMLPVPDNFVPAMIPLRDMLW
jgi:arylsulfatase A-like enzyme